MKRTLDSVQDLGACKELPFDILLHLFSPPYLEPSVLHVLRFVCKPYHAAATHLAHVQIGQFKANKDANNANEKSIFNFQVSKSSLLSCAATWGSVSLAEWCTTDLGLEWSSKASEITAKNGHVHLLQWAWDSYRKIDENVLFGAVRGGHTSVLEWCQSKIRNFVQFEYLDSFFDEYLHINMAKYLLDMIPETEKESFFENGIAKACSHGNIEVISFLLEKFPTFTVPKTCFENAAIHGHQHVLEFFESKMAIDYKCVFMACCATDSRLKEWLFSKLETPLLEIDEFSCFNIANNGHLDWLKFLEEKGIELSPSAIARGAASGGYLEILDWILPQTDGSEWVDSLDIPQFKVWKYLIEKKIVRQFVYIENLLESFTEPITFDFVDWAYKHKYGLSEKIFEDAFNLVDKKLLEHIIKLDGDVPESIELFGASLENIEYAQSLGVKLLWTNNSSKWYAKSGNIEVLYWAYENNCKISYSVFSAAAEGHLEIVEWALTTVGLKWHPEIFYLAALKGQLEILKFVGKAYEWNPKTAMRYAQTNFQMHVVRWISENSKQEPLCYNDYFETYSSRVPNNSKLLPSIFTEHYLELWLSKISGNNQEEEGEESEEESEEGEGSEEESEEGVESQEEESQDE